MCPVPAGSEPGPDVGAMVHAYGRKFVHHDSGLALQYYMQAAAARGNSIAVKGQVSMQGSWPCSMRA